MGQVGANPAHPGRQVDDQIGLGVVQQGQRRLALHQVVVLAAGDEDVSRAVRTQRLCHEGAEEAGATPVTVTRLSRQKVALLGQSGFMCYACHE